jgi:FHA domain/Cysteine-rich secretory protein family
MGQQPRSGDSSRGTVAARLVAVGGSTPREYRLRAGKTSIGYAKDNDIVLDASTVSRYHAMIRRRIGGYTLTDLESTNGTFVNGLRIKNPTGLKRGDDVRFGEARFAFLARRRSIVREFRSIRLFPLALITLFLFVIGFGVARYRVWKAARLGVTNGVAAPSAANDSVAAQSAATSANNGSSGRGNAPSATEPEWLALLNWYRRLSGLEPVSEDSKLSAGDQAHVRYLLANYSEALRNGAMPGGEMHEERDGSPGYSPDGAKAGKQSDVDFVYWHGHQPEGLVNFAILDWISGAFHRLPLLNPNLRRVGYYDFCGGGICVAAMNAIAGADGTGLRQSFPRPLKFPPADAGIDLRTFENEWPDPLSACPGYAAPTGLPITLSLGSFVPAKLEGFSVESVSPDGTSSKVEACGFDAATYVNSESYGQSAGRDVLAANGSVVVIPRRPLTRGATYSVRMTVNGHEYAWTFSVNN